jgi:phosphatidylserine/phosphatidylglycerophosphate/cardiolipin synthase-like enzyme
LLLWRCQKTQNRTGLTIRGYSVGHALDYALYFNEHFTATTITIDHTPMEEALLGPIDDATTSIGVALYGLNRQSVVTALIAAHSEGVTVQVVGDDEAATGEYSSSYQVLTDAGITVVVDSDTSKIQHNKFLIVDGEVVWMGSTNFTDTGLTLNANNSIVITDTTLAGVYLTEFEEMWVGSFQDHEADNMPHLPDYDGTGVECFFSPTDLVAFEVWDELANAEESIHFGMFFCTDDVLADRVVERLGAGVEVYGVWAAFGVADTASVDGRTCAAGAQIKTENFAGKVHHKFAVIDVEGSDPLVVLGSYN